MARAQRRALYGRQYQYNQLRSLLREVHPAALTAWSELPGNLLRGEARAVLAAAPTPSRAARLTKRRLFDLLRHGGRTRILDDQAARLRDHFRQPVLRQRPAVEEAMGQQILMCLALLDQACRNVDALTEQVQEAFEAHPQAKIYLSFPRCGALTGARCWPSSATTPTGSPTPGACARTPAPRRSPGRPDPARRSATAASPTSG
ncbi:hypothetical protein [Streptomyces murinus]|uniref:hypothetical protein n=1 Tax=Streptomyces murinus TaxID=33900 RepID=UPI0037F345BC